MKILKLIIALVVLSTNLSGEERSYESFESSFCCLDERGNNFSVEAQSAVFFPLDSRVRRLYGSVLPAFTLEGNWQYRCWDMWLNCSYIFGNGHTSGPNENSTHLSLVPITFGVKYIHPLSNGTELYIGLGASYSFLNIRDHSEFVHKRVSSSNFGGIVKTGITYALCENFFIDGFLNYTYQRFSFPSTSSDPFVYRRDANLDSLQLGLGVGASF